MLQRVFDSFGQPKYIFTLILVEEQRERDVPRSLHDFTLFAEQTPSMVELELRVSHIDCPVFNVFVLEDAINVHLSTVEIEANFEEVVV